MAARRAEETAEDRLLRTFLELVRIDSPSGRESAVADYCEDALAAAGMAVTRDDSARMTGSDTGNLVATLPGTAAGVALVLSAHMDCVQPCEGVEPVVADGFVTSAGETVLGADDKAGIAAIIELVRRITADRRPHAGIRVVLTVAEEMGLVGAKALDAALLAGDVCLVLDADGSPGEIVVSSPTHYTFSAAFRGRSSHAGVAPEAGVSAIAMASRAVCAMPLGRLDAETTANVGTVVGGSATNVVPAEVTLTGECRSRDRDRVERVREAMDRALREAASEAGGGVEVSWRLEYEGVTFAEDDPRLRLVRRACRRSGLEPRAIATGGGSDGNIFSSVGVPTIVLACGMSGVHSTGETLRIGDLGRLAVLLEAVVAEAAGGP
ncbi:MAG: M20/M25/M40 family metallo-hydrolase [Coriobacteriia bacterium]|nr:M20/M25/M40 family metallo-hydrolase [Coriobacteriia bacterium]